jgi:hypothetical protein
MHDVSITDIRMVAGTASASIVHPIALGNRIACSAAVAPDLRRDALFASTKKDEMMAGVLTNN